jgi:hypothetical protein
MKEPEEFPVIYANFVRITHSPLEFLLDFKRVGPESPEAEEAPTLMRIVMNPVIAKSFREALTENVRRYEQNLGAIPPAPGGGSVVH